MTVFFAKSFRDKSHCSQCRAMPAEGKRFCPQHLKAAKLRFRAWSAECRKRGLCVECHGRSLPGFLRCAAHRERNRKVCLRWSASHGDWRAFQSAFYRYTCMALNICTRCRRGKAREGHTVCLKCRIYQLRVQLAPARVPRADGMTVLGRDLPRLALDPTD